MRVRLVVLLLTASWVSCARMRTVVSEVPAVLIPAQMVRFEHVFVVVEENQNYEEVIGNTKDLPYLNTLAAKYGVATNYYANTRHINRTSAIVCGRKEAARGLEWTRAKSDPR